MLDLPRALSSNDSSNHMVLPEISRFLHEPQEAGIQKLYRGAQMPWLGWHMGHRERRSGSYANCPSIAKS